MKIIILLSAVVGASIAAPTRDGPSYDVHGVRRLKKSAYGAGPSYGAAGSSYGGAGSSYGAVGASYGAPCSHGSIGYAASAPVPLYLAPQSAAHYREDEETEGEHGEAPAARSYGGGYGASSGAAVGVFPNAKVGGCAVPLLLSCAPSVVSGHVVSAGYGAPAAGYKDAAEKDAQPHAQWTSVHALRAADSTHDLPHQPQPHAHQPNQQDNHKQ